MGSVARISLLSVALLSFGASAQVRCIMPNGVVIEQKLATSCPQGGKAIGPDGAVLSAPKQSIISAQVVPASGPVPEAQDTYSVLMGWLPFAILGAVGWFILRRRWRRINLEKYNAAVDEANEFFKELNRTREFPPVGPSRLLSKPDAPLLYVAPAELHELKTTTSRNMIGTRVKVAGLPIYLGRSTPSSSTTLGKSADGQLGLTTKSLVFSGDLRLQDFPLKRVASVSKTGSGLQISLQGRAKPLWVEVENPHLWHGLITLATQVQLTGRTLPEGVSLV